MVVNLSVFASSHMGLSTLQTNVVNRGYSTVGRSSIAESFDRYFSVELDNVQALRDRIFRLRYQVYCEEFKYEPAENFPERMEYDEFDLRSTQCLVIHKYSGRSVGCVRLVPTDPSNPQASLPFEKPCGHTIAPEHQEALRKLARSSVCEISRLAVSRKFRGRAGEANTQYGNVSKLEFSESEKRVFPYIAVSLFLAATVLTELTNRRNVFAMMAPTLPRIMNRAGIVLQKVGNVIEYHGQRAVHFITTDAVLEGMKPEFRDIYEIIKESLEADYQAANIARDSGRL